MSRPPRLLFVAIPSSIHAVRNLAMVADLGWDLHLFPAKETNLHPGFRHVTVHDDWWIRPAGLHPSVRLVGELPLPLGRHEALANRALRRLREVAPVVGQPDRAARLTAVIRRLRPDLVHGYELLLAGQLLRAAKAALGPGFPPWVMSTWGSDLNLYGQHPEHAHRVRAVLEACDYVRPEANRDLGQAAALGFRGEWLTPRAGMGGFDLARLAALRTPGPPSARRVILLKGLQGWAGRALFGLRALALAADALREYRVLIHQPADEVRLAAPLIAAEHGLRIELLPYLEHEEMLRRHGQARLSLGVSFSDGVPNSMLEAMAMGAFPVESTGSCALEWITPGETGFVVPPEDPAAIAAVIRRVMADDALVDRAAERNARVIAERLDAGPYRAEAVATYERLVRVGRGRRP
jgi:hypothetical protein